MVVTPVGTNAQATAVADNAEIRLVLPITTTPGAPVAFFTYAPSTGITTATRRRVQRERVVSCDRQP